MVKKLESVEVVSHLCCTLLYKVAHCNLVNKNYQQVSNTLFSFVPDKQFAQITTIIPHSLTVLKTTNAKFQSIEVW